MTTSYLYMSKSTGGSIAAAICATGMGDEEVLDLLVKSARDKTFNADIDNGIKTMLRQTMPEDAYSRCSGRLHVTLTRVRPKFQTKPVIVSQFASNEELIESVAASCFIPLWSSMRLTTTVGKEEHSFIDGGVFAFVPALHRLVDHDVVSVTPLHEVYGFLHRRRKPVDISPILLSNFNHSLPRLVRWALDPPSDEMLLDLYRAGEESAHIWADKREKSLEILE